MAENLRPAVFLDRDGVIIVEKNFIADVRSLELIPGASDGLKKLDTRFLKVVVSNQSGIARGFFTLNDVNVLNEALDGRLREMGVVIDGWYLCPHSSDDGCFCRKPSPGMLIQASEDLGIDLDTSWMIGDKSSDIGAGRAAGVHTILVNTGYGGAETNGTSITADYVADDLNMAVDIIIRGEA